MFEHAFQGWNNLFRIRNTFRLNSKSVGNLGEVRIPNKGMASKRFVEPVFPLCDHPEMGVI